MKVLILNDTRVEQNMGCHATVNTLIEFIVGHLPDSEITTILLGTDYDAARRFDFKKKRYNDRFFSKVKRIGKILGIAIRNDIGFDFKKWKSNYKSILSDETKQQIKNCDLLILNAEGTIHHNSIGGIVLISQLYYAIKQKKKTVFVNGSFQAMDQRLTKKVLSKVDFISVREPLSVNELKKNEISAFLIPDFAFLIEANLNHTTTKKEGQLKKCIYTSGVLAAYPNQKDGFGMEVINKHIDAIIASGYIPSFLKIEEIESSICKKIEERGIEIIDGVEKYNYQNITGLLSQYDLLISGRYHVGIFGLLSGVNTLFLPSNTHKIVGLLKMLDLPEDLLINDDLSKELILERSMLHKNGISINEMDIFKNYDFFKQYLRSV